MIYDHPRYYELLFSFRDIEAEVGFLDLCARRFGGDRVQRLLEIGCGPALHAGPLQALGYSYRGLDNNPTMLGHAQQKWQGLKPLPRLIKGDMVDFRMDEPVDMAFVLMGSLNLSNDGELRSHFDALASALRPGGLYVLDWCLQFTDPLGDKAGKPFRVSRDGIDMVSWIDIRPVDPSHQIYEERWTVSVTENGATRMLTMLERNKALMPEEFRRFVDNRDDFEFVGWWTDCDLAHPIDGASEVLRPIAIVRRV